MVRIAFRTVRRVLFASSVALLAASPVVAVPLVYYTVQDLQLGDTSTKASVPSTVESSAGSGEQRVRAIFDQLRALKPELYKNAELVVGSDFGVTGQVVVKIEGLTDEDFDILASELFHSLSVHGASSILVPALGDAPLALDRVSFPALHPVVPAWEALPPRKYSSAIIVLPNGTTESAVSFYDRLKKRDKALATSVLETLRSRNAAGKVRLLQSLSELAVDDVATAVLPAVEDASSRVRLAAIKALDEQRSNPKVKAALEKAVESDPNPDVKAAAVRVLIAAGVTKYEVFAYIERLKDPNDGVVFDAVNKLVAANNAAVAPALADVLSHGSVEVREAALKGLVKLANGDGLSRALTSDKVSSEMKLSVAKAMTGLGDNQFVAKGLAHIVVAGNAADAQRAAAGLGELKVAATVPALVTGLSNGSPEVRVAAAKALGEIASTDALAPLAKLSLSATASDRQAAIDAALRVLTTQPQARVIELSRDPDLGVRRLAIMALSNFSDGGRNRAVVGVLRESLKDSSAEIKQAGVFALARIQDEAVATELLALKTDSDATIRAQVATAMGWSKNASAVDTLIELMGDASSEVKQAAAEGLGKQKARKGLDTLLQYVSYGKPEVKRAVFQALNAVGEPADLDKLLDIYSTALYDQDKQVKILAAEGISIFRDPRTVTALSGLTIDSDPDVQKAVLARLGAFKDPNATEAICRALFAEDKTVRMAALEALKVSAQSNAQKPLQEFIKNETDAELRAKANEVYDTL
jgi:HEAT repeat protein